MSEQCPPLPWVISESEETPAHLVLVVQEVFRQSRADKHNDLLIRPALLSLEPRPKSHTRNLETQDCHFTREGWSKGKEKCHKDFLLLLSSFSWFSICLVALNFLLFSRVLRKLALTVSNFFLMSLWRDGCLKLPTLSQWYHTLVSFSTSNFEIISDFKKRLQK